MKKYLFVMVLGAILISCKGPGGDKAKVTDAHDHAKASETAKTIAVDLERSIVTWVGSKPAGKHNGTINLLSGTVSVEEGNVTAGEFVMDMNSLKSTDEGMNDENNEKLTKHLQGVDFFDVASYGKAKFVVSKVEDIAAHASEDALKLEGATHYVTGNLTLKDSTKGVSFPAIIKVSDDGVSANAEFNINRTDWGMHYGNDKSFGDKFIHPKVKIGFVLEGS